MEVNWPGKKGWKAQNFKLPKNKINKNFKLLK